MKGTVVVSLVVDAEGRPQNVALLAPVYSDLDKLALRIAGMDRFTPGRFEGRSVAVAIALVLRLQGCVAQIRNEEGLKVDILRLRSQPDQRIGELPQPASGTPIGPDRNSGELARVGGNVKAPIVLNNVAARYSDQARRAKIQGICLIRLIVDAQGMPQNPMVIGTLDPGLDQNAIEAVMKYRFKPAMKGNQPVPVMITVEVNFRLY